MPPFFIISMYWVTLLIKLLCPFGDDSSNLIWYITGSWKGSIYRINLRLDMIFSFRETSFVTRALNSWFSSYKCFIISSISSSCYLAYSSFNLVERSVRSWKRRRAACSVFSRLATIASKLEMKPDISMVSLAWPAQQLYYSRHRLHTNLKAVW